MQGGGSWEARERRTRLAWYVTHSLISSQREQLIIFVAPVLVCTILVPSPVDMDPLLSTTQMRRQKSCVVFATAVLRPLVNWCCSYRTFMSCWVRSGASDRNGGWKVDGPAVGAGARE